MNIHIWTSIVLPICNQWIESRHSTLKKIQVVNKFRKFIRALISLLMCFQPIWNLTEILHFHKDNILNLRWRWGISEKNMCVRKICMFCNILYYGNYEFILKPKMLCPFSLLVLHVFPGILENITSLDPMAARKEVGALKVTSILS